MAELTSPPAYKRQEVTQGLRELLTKLSVGDRLPPIATLKEHFSASTSTVVAALEELAQEGLILRKHGSGNFLLEAPVASMPRTASGLIALLSTPFSAASWFTQIVNSVERELRLHGQSPVLILEPAATKRFQLLEERWSQGLIAGYIHVGSILDGAPVPSTIPGVVIGEVPEGSEVHQIRIDGFDGGQKIATHLWELGHRKIAYIYSRPLQLIATPRLNGLRDIWRQHSAPFLPYDVMIPEATSPDLSYQERLRPVIEPLVTGQNPVTALVAFNDTVAVEIIHTLESLGHRVPEDVSVVGYDDLQPLSTHSSPPLTTAHISGQVLGSLAAQVFSEIVEPGGAIRCLRVPAELIVRQSTAPVSRRR